MRRDLSWVELSRSLREPLVEEVAVALEGDEGVGVAGDGLDELDVGAGCDEAADAGVAEVVEAVERFAVGVDELGVAEGWLPDAAVEVGGVERAAAFGLEDELARGVGAVLDGTGSEVVQGGPDAGEDRNGADAGLALGPLQLVATIGLFDMEEMVGAVDVLPAERADFAEAKAGAEGEVEEVNPDKIGLACAERVGRCERDQSLADLRGLRPDPELRQAAVEPGSERFSDHR